MTDTVKPYTDEDVENLRRSLNDVRNHPPTPRVVRRLLATLDERTRERDAEAHAAINHAECAERSLRSACDARDALDSVAAVLGVDTTTDADTEARACVAAVVALREEVERLRDHALTLDGQLHEAEAARAAAERRSEEAEGRLRDYDEAARIILDNSLLRPPEAALTCPDDGPAALYEHAEAYLRRATLPSQEQPTDDADDRRASTEERRG